MKPQIDDLVAFEIFRGFEPQELGAVANALNATELAAGETLFEEGARGSSMFYLFQGGIRIERASGELLAQLQAPAILGEMAVLEHKPRSASAVADGKAVLWEMDEQSLQRLAATGNMAAYKIMRWIATGLSDRLRKMNETVSALNARVVNLSKSAEWDAG